MSPDDLVDQVVGSVDLVSDTVIIDIKSDIITPVISPALFRPLDVSCAHVFYLAAIIDEGIAVDLIFFRAGGEVDADVTFFKRIVIDLVEIGVIDKYAFLSTDNPVACYH